MVPALEQRPATPTHNYSAVFQWLSHGAILPHLVGGVKAPFKTEV